MSSQSKRYGDEPKHFGPIHGEQTRRHQMVVAGTRHPVIVSFGEGNEGHAWVEFMHQADGFGGALVGAHMTIAEAKDLRDWLNEYIEARDA